MSRASRAGGQRGYPRSGSGLRELANRLGIVSEYVDATRGTVRRTSDATREALLSSMGFDAPTEDAARGWLAELDHEARGVILDPVRVVRRDDASANRVHLRLPAGIPAGDVELLAREESGHEWRVKAPARGSVQLSLPTRLPYGYHSITAYVRGPGGSRTAEQTLIVVPASCVTPEMLLGDSPRVMGLWANLYSVRREQDWGIGDLTSYLALAEWAAARGAEFVGVNPLHALFNRGNEVSPYSPVSRLFRNPVYIDVQAVPELAHCEPARTLLSSTEIRGALKALRSERYADYERAIDVKQRVLAELHRAFLRAPGSAQRRRDYGDFVRAREPELTRFATWMVLAESSGAPDWRAWPSSLHDANAAGVAAFQTAHAERVDFHRWLQFEADRQLAAVSERARTLGMRIGVYQDLAIGTSPGGSDTWSYPDLFLTGACVGAPPDPYSRFGQNWGLPPIDPRALLAQRYRYWIQLLRRAFEHAGALRIDHVMGLFRSFWIPEGGTGLDGAYIRFPSSDLLGILALESVRHDAMVVGEDLGTVPPEVPPALRAWGILSSKAMYFERDKRGFKGARQYPPLALASANTHDMPTLAGFWSEHDIELRARVGLLPTARDVRRAKAARRADKTALLRLLKLPEPRPYDRPHFARTLTGAVHDFLCSTRSALVALSFDDLVGETDPVNVPGVGPDRYPSWRRRVRMPLEEVSWHFEVDDAIRCAGRRHPSS